MWDKTGYVHLHRKIVKHFLWDNGKQFSRAEAWLDLIMGASSKDEIVTINGADHQNYRGTILTSKSLLATRWKWDRSKVSRFLALLKKELMIGREHLKAQKISRITIIMYDEMNDGIPENEPLTATKKVVGNSLKTNEDDEIIKTSSESQNDPVMKSDDDFIKQVIDYLNSKTEKYGIGKFLPSTPKSRSAILARQKDGYTFESFKRVINDRVANCAGNRQMHDNLKPIALFGKEFKKYFNRLPKELRYVKMAQGQKLSQTILLDDGKIKSKHRNSQNNPAKKLEDDFVNKVIDYLNEKTKIAGKMAYDPTTPEYRKVILARSDEEYTLEDFKRVIDVKIADWLGNKEMEAYLRPTTLFGAKFKEYVKQMSPKIPKYK